MPRNLEISMLLLCPLSDRTTHSYIIYISSGHTYLLFAYCSLSLSLSLVLFSYAAFACDVARPVHYSHSLLLHRLGKWDTCHVPHSHANKLRKIRSIFLHHLLTPPQADIQICGHCRRSNVRKSQQQQRPVQSLIMLNRTADFF